MKHALRLLNFLLSNQALNVCEPFNADLTTIVVSFRATEQPFSLLVHDYEVSRLRTLVIAECKSVIYFSESLLGVDERARTSEFQAWRTFLSTVLKSKKIVNGYRPTPFQPRISVN